MNHNSVRFGCTALLGTNKVGLLTPDADGYYEVVVGALDVFNSAGQYYVYEQSREIFESSSQFMRRVKKGSLNGENGHPKPQIGQSESDFARRVLSIYEERICCHHKEIWLDFDRVKDEKGRPIIAIMSKVKPSGELGYVLDEALKNKDKNVCFSIRSFTKDYYHQNVIKRALKAVVTFDLVNEPGIAYADKYHSPVLESYSGDSMIINRGQFERAILAARTTAGIGTESAILTAEDLFKTMGWSMSLESQDGPAWANW